MSRKFKRQMVEDSVLVDVRCNKCGESCIKNLGGTTPEVYAAQVSYSTGYASSPLPDGVTYNFDLCEPCLAALMDSLKVPAHESGWME